MFQLRVRAGDCVWGVCEYKKNSIDLSLNLFQDKISKAKTTLKFWFFEKNKTDNLLSRLMEKRKKEKLIISGIKKVTSL